MQPPPRSKIQSPLFKRYSARIGAAVFAQVTQSVGSVGSVGTSADSVSSYRFDELGKWIEFTFVRDGARYNNYYNNINKMMEGRKEDKLIRKRLILRKGCIFNR